MLVATFQKCFHQNPQDLTGPDIKRIKYQKMSVSPHRNDNVAVSYLKLLGRIASYDLCINFKQRHVFNYFKYFHTKIQFLCLKKQGKEYDKIVHFLQ